MPGSSVHPGVRSGRTRQGQGDYECVLTFSPVRVSGRGVCENYLRQVSDDVPVKPDL